MDDINNHELQLEIAELCIHYSEYHNLLNEKKAFRRWWSKPLIRDNHLTGYG